MTSEVLLFARRRITFGLSLITLPGKIFGIISLRNSSSDEMIGIPKVKLASFSNTIITNGPAALLLCLGLLYTVGTAPFSAAIYTYE
jgi:hypothetical protein